MSVRHNHQQAPMRQFSLADRLVTGADRMLRSTLKGSAKAAQRENPATDTEQGRLQPDERRNAARMMRVNHSGEVAAQALYHGQAATARDNSVATAMSASAAEEADHLAWCEERINELGGRPSLLNPLWYAGSFTIGALAGLAGDRWSLGFVAETERQVVDHLDGHLNGLPPGDHRSRAILERMRDEEAEHGAKATQAGGRQLPAPIKLMMGAVSKVMTRTAYWI